MANLKMENFMGFVESFGEEQKDSNIKENMMKMNVNKYDKSQKKENNDQDIDKDEKDYY